jgi:hypothetical protein
MCRTDARIGHTPESATEIVDSIRVRVNSIRNTIEIWKEDERHLEHAFGRQ